MELKQLVERLEEMTGKKVELTEAEVSKQLKKRFYGVTADFERELKRLIKFYEDNTPLHPDLKVLRTRILRLENSFDNIFFQTEVYMDKDKQPMEIAAESELDEEYVSAPDVLRVGDHAQVYPLGEAYTGSILKFGPVTGIMHDHEEKMNITFDPKYKTEDDDVEWFSEASFDIVRVSESEPQFKKRFKDTFPIPKGGASQNESTTTADIAVPGDGALSITKRKIQEDDVQTIQSLPGDVKKKILSIEGLIKPLPNDVGHDKQKIYDQFVDLLSLYDLELKGNISTVPIERLQELNADLDNFIKSYSLPL